MDAKQFVPMNANERLLHAIVLRQEVMIEQLNSLINHIAEKEGVATTDNKVEEKVAEVQEEPKPKTRTRKTVKKEVKDEPTGTDAKS